MRGACPPRTFKDRLLGRGVAKGPGQSGLGYRLRRALRHMAAADLSRGPHAKVIMWSHDASQKTVLYRPDSSLPRSDDKGRTHVA